MLDHLQARWRKRSRPVFTGAALEWLKTSHRRSHEMPWLTWETGWCRSVGWSQMSFWHQVICNNHATRTRLLLVYENIKLSSIDIAAEPLSHVGQERCALIENRIGLNYELLPVHLKKRLLDTNKVKKLQLIRNSVTLGKFSPTNMHLDIAGIKLIQG